MVSRLLDRGSEILTVYPAKTVTDSRGESLVVPDRDNPISIRVSVSTDRQSDAEIDGQVSVKLLKVMTRSIPTGNQSWSACSFRGEEWDIAAPPAQCGVTKALRHYEFFLRGKNGYTE